MAFKKIDKDFVLSDSSLNVYGFKLRTDGCVMAEVLKNPIGYYNHEKTDGVLLKWEDVRLSGDKIMGKPTINMEHPRADRTIKEIEDGFLNAASVGHICLLDYEMEDNPDDANSPILVGLKWYYKEASVVDSPGNRNAFKVGLYDGDDKEINLSDLTQILKTKNTGMKKIELPISAALIEMLNLSDEPTAAEVAKGITALNDRAKAAETGLQDLKDATTKKEVSDLLDNAMAAKKITAEQKTLLSKQYEKKPADLKDLLETMVGFTSVNSKLNLSNKAGKDELELTPKAKALYDKGWDKLDREGGLADLKDESEEAYLALYVKKFGYMPNEKPFQEPEAKKKRR